MFWNSGPRILGPHAKCLCDWQYVDRRNGAVSAPLNLMGTIPLPDLTRPRLNTLMSVGGALGLGASEDT